MTPERWQQVKGLLHEAKQLVPEQRSAFLERACSDDQSLRQELESLLASAEKAPPGFLESAMATAPGKFLDRYEIVSLLGAGGMGEVYLALDTQLKRKVALKLLPTHITQNTDQVRRFEREAYAASALN